jgi:hypothetical protein
MTRVRAALAAVVLLTACGTDSMQPPAQGGEAAFVAEVGSYQLLTDRPNRFLVGLFGLGGRWVSFGEATLHFTDPDGNTPDGMDAVPAAFLPIPGTPEDGDGPTLTLPTEGRGVYVARDVAFDAPGFWEVEATVELADGTETATAAFEVLAEPKVPAVGDMAPSVDHPTLDDDGDPGVLDSRARDGGPFPDPELHRLSVADALDAGRPTLLLFSTPVFCSSRFCGPITDLAAELHDEYGDQVSFVHVEVWEDFESQALNPAVEPWVAGLPGQVFEPWTYLIDADGEIVGSWDNVATRDEVEGAIQALLDA